ncbi:MAG: hypothetical protein KatS3mg054_0072 [Chloroflexus sp.]|nr:MAG: hypothetical protein KatS3mg054_0072 [Chloroflexus sp.]
MTIVPLPQVPRLGNRRFWVAARPTAALEQRKKQVGNAAGALSPHATGGWASGQKESNMVGYLNCGLARRAAISADCLGEAAEQLAQVPGPARLKGFALGRALWAHGVHARRVACVDLCGPCITARALEYAAARATGPEREILDSALELVRALSLVEDSAAARHYAGKARSALVQAYRAVGKDV